MTVASITPKLLVSSATYGYVCKKWKTGHEPTDTPPTSEPVGHCGDDGSKTLVEFGGYCYKFAGVENHEEGLTWDQAKQACEQLNNNYQLASIHSERESAFVYTMFPYLPSANKEQEFWIGANDRGDAETDEGKWKYTDATPFDYTHWADGEPNGSPEVSSTTATFAKQISFSFIVLW